MSYCRRNPGKSDVYLYAPMRGGVTCCGCDLDNDKILWFRTNVQALVHLREHVAAGHLVPSYAIQRLREECLKRCYLCGIEFETSQEHPQRRFATCCLQCDLDAWDLEQQEWDTDHRGAEE